jgi:hypothetical protein
VVVTEPHERGSDRQVDLTLSEAEPAALLCVADDDPDDRFLLESEAATSHTFRLQALRYATGYRCAVGATCPGAEIEALSVAVSDPPGFFPPVEVTADPTLPEPEGWLLAGVLTEGCIGPGQLTVWDLEGRLRWHAPLTYTGLDFELSHLGDGILLYGGHAEREGPIFHHVWDGELLAADVPGDPYLHHDCKEIADGRIITLEERDNERGSEEWIGFAVQAFDPLAGTFEELWDSQAAVDEGALPPGSGDAWHTNWIDVLDHGEGLKLYASQCYLYTVIRVDLATGAVDWVFGPGGDFALQDADGDPLPDALFSQCQHGLEVSADGTRLLIYDNGWDRGTSRAAEFALDEAAGVATLLWSWTDGWYEELLGDVDWLPGGTVLVTQAHPECYSDEGLTSAVEIDPVTGEERWRMTFLDEWHAAYRSQRLDGCELFSNVGQCAALELRWGELAPSFGF